MASRDTTPPRDEGAAAITTTSTHFPETSTSADKPSAEPKRKRHKSLRTALRQLLNRSTTEAIGKFGSQDRSDNRRAVGTSTMEIETGTQVGETPAKKHVHVSVIMSLSDDPTCACSCPPPVIPTNTPTPVQQVKKWWWVVVPILAYGLWATPPFQSTIEPGPQAPISTVQPPATAGGVVHPVAGHTPAPAPLPAPSPNPNPIATSGAPTSVIAPPGAGVQSSGSTSQVPAMCPNNEGNFSTVPDYASPHSPNWVKSQTVNWFVKRLPQCGVSVQAYDVCGNLLEAQQYGDDAAYLGQTLYLHKGSQLQIDQLDAHDQLKNRTTYIVSGTPSRRVTTVYQSDSQLHLLFEARIVYDSESSNQTAELWAFDAHGQATSPVAFNDNDQITANVAPHFYHFSNFAPGNW